MFSMVEMGSSLNNVGTGPCALNRIYITVEYISFYNAFNS
jgi:hypothetical protein